MRGDGPDGDGQPDLDGQKPTGHGPSPKTLLIAAVVVIGLGYFLSVKLREMGHMQDCIMSGRTNCAPIAGADK